MTAIESKSPESVKTPEPKTDENKTDWSRRFTDPMMRFRWQSEIRVEPARREKGEHYGFRIFPDGTREQFYVE